MSATKKDAVLMLWVLGGFIAFLPYVGMAIFILTNVLRDLFLGLGVLP